MSNDDTQTKTGNIIRHDTANKSVTFQTSLRRAEGKNATGISIPPEAIAALGTQKKPSVIVRLNGYTYRTTVAVYGDEFLIPFSQAHRQSAGIEAGDQVEVTIALDLEPRTVEVPDDLRQALMAEPGANETFETLAYSKRKEFVRQVEEAKSEDTRKRRITNVVSKVMTANQ